MRKLINGTVVPLAILLGANVSAQTTAAQDSARIVHVLDGMLDEWKAGRFETDRDTHIAYAVDNDKDYLYVALKIDDPRMQMKIMMQGMDMYIDKNGKKRERQGIQFPVKREGSGFEGRGTESGDKRAPDPAEMRERLAGNLVFLKTFGFEDEDKVQIISQPGSANVSFHWDDANVMTIEYQVPLSLFGGAAVSGKPFGIGWKLYGIDQQQQAQTPAITSSRIVSVPAGTRPTTSPGAAGSSNFRSQPGTNDSRFKEQNIWTRYTITN